MTLEEFKARKKYMREEQLKRYIEETTYSLWEEPLRGINTSSREVAEHYRGIGLKVSGTSNGWIIEIPD